jgi:2-amino-4-hydroxy-6-hydroxymethyldihydropteridine diphosphokinase
MINDDRSVQDADEAQREACRTGNHLLLDWPSVHLGLGSNLGDREANLREAIARIEKLGLKIVRRSSIYETEPVGYQDQPWFLNQVIETFMPPELIFYEDAETTAQLNAGAETERQRPVAYKIVGLLRALLDIEREMGRERTIVNGPRVIDIDILLNGKRQSCFCKTQSADANPAIAIAEPPLLIIPHPRMHERRFVLTPLCEIAPDLIPPGMKQTCCEMLAALDDPSVVRVYKSSRKR